MVVKCCYCGSNEAIAISDDHGSASFQTQTYFTLSLIRTVHVALCITHLAYLWLKYARAEITCAWVNAVCNNIIHACKPSATSELAVWLGLEVTWAIRYTLCKSCLICRVAFRKIAEWGHLVKMDIGGRRLKAVCVVES